MNEPTAVSTDADTVRAWFDPLGRQVVLLGHGNPEAPLFVNLTADGQVIVAPGAGVSLYIKKGSVHNNSDTERRHGRARGRLRRHGTVEGEARGRRRLPVRLR